MTSLYVDRRGVELRMDGGAIAFYENDERIGTVPVAPLERIFLRGDVLLHSGLLGRLGENGVGVVVLSGRKGIPTMLLAKPHNDAARRVAQYRLSQDGTFCLAIARSLVAGKMDGAERHLRDLSERKHAAKMTLQRNCETLKGLMSHIERQESLEALRGLEGRAAAVYFEGLAAFLPPHLGFVKRNRRPPRDPFNAVLSLGYTLLHADVVLAVYGAGLDPYIGFLHGLHFGRESLASDLIEPLRPYFDRFAVKLFTDGHLRAENFTVTSDGCFLGKAGRARFYQLYEDAAEGFRKHATETIRDLIALLKEHDDRITTAETAADDDETEDSGYDDGEPVEPGAPDGKDGAGGGVKTAWRPLS
ncbi:MAG: CRISPR-associated endonuclease Cas1 [Methylobacteriaceae bacterium]|jgi:CRISPR-associated protein Cas1|nr:CRISPR-associated endonuclease Cas1 [Methylobacteriaceae bacterium]